VTIFKGDLKVEKLAKIYDAEIEPLWGTRFGKLLLRDLQVPERGQVLEISCGTGSPTLEILRRMGDGARLIAIDASSAMLDVARKKVAALGPLGKKGIFFRTESPVPRLSFADRVYDLVLCNLGLEEMPALDPALRDFTRVCKVGGQVRCTLPLAGTFQEFFDIYREVLVKHDRTDALERLDAHVARYPTVDTLTRSMRKAELAGEVEVEEFSLLFKSSREFFFAPVIEFGPLAAWKEIAGEGQAMQDVFWHIKEAIDAYFGGRAFQVTVKAGCLVGTRRDPAELALERDDDVDTGRIVLAEPGSLPRPPREMAAGSVRSELEIVDEEELDEGDLEDARPPRSAAAPLDAFIEGRQRPAHLGATLDVGRTIEIVAVHPDDEPDGEDGAGAYDAGAYEAAGWPRGDGDDDEAVEEVDDVVEDVEELGPAEAPEFLDDDDDELPRA
jgi:ubiquinone/menaquinone biosynthesis C-methylase UbiE